MPFLLSAWDIAVPFAVLAAVCALTPGVIAIIAVRALIERAANAVSTFIGCCAVSFALAAMFASTIPYRDLPSSFGSAAGVMLGVCLTASGVISLFILITSAESEDRSMADWND